MEDKEKRKVTMPFHVATTDGAFVDGFASLQEATQYCSGANKRAETLGIKARYKTVGSPRVAKSVD